MNANTYNIEIHVERQQVEEAVLSLFHTILLHRSMGKFTYRQEKAYSIGTIGTEDIDCEYLDFTFVRMSSKLLDAIIRKNIVAFREQLMDHSYNGIALGTITLEFFQKRRSHWPFSEECVPWEIWNVQITERSLPQYSKQFSNRESAVTKLGEKIISIVEAVGRHDFLPKMPELAELPLVFDTSFPDVQPFLFKIYYNFGGASSTSKTNSVSSTVRRLFRDMTI